MKWAAFFAVVFAASMAVAAKTKTKTVVIVKVVGDESSTFTTTSSVPVTEVTVTQTVTAGSTTPTTSSTPEVATTTFTTVVTLTTTPPPAPSTSTATITAVVTVTKTPPPTSTQTAVVTVVTTTAPIPTVIYYKKTCGATVKCPAGTKQISRTQPCLETYYQGKLASSTCVAASCCTARTPKTTTMVTSCAAAKVVCPQYTLPLTDNKGVSVPCFHTYTGKKLVATTCVAGTCCTRATPNRSVACNLVIKCRTYKVDPKTRKIQTCNTNKNKADVCTIKRCCGMV